MKTFKKIEAEKLQDNVFQLINNDWMLITAGKKGDFNTMTASWGGLGILWHKKVATCYIRPQRHTYKYVEENEYFTLSFFNEEHRSILNYCGKYSGRDYDKVKETGLTPIDLNNGAIGFDQSRLILVCKKLYFGDIQPENFIDPAIQKNYAKKDYHRFYIGEIEEILIAD